MNAELYLTFGLVISGVFSLTAQIDESRNQQDFIVQSAVKAATIEAGKSGERIRLELRNNLINKAARMWRESSARATLSGERLNPLQTALLTSHRAPFTLAICITNFTMGV